MAVESPVHWSSRLLFRPVPGSLASPLAGASPVATRDSSPPPSSPAPIYNLYAPAPAKFSDKIILPPSVLEALLAQSPAAPLPSPLTFRLTNPATRQTTHAGVREFSADEGVAQIPAAVAQRIGLQELAPVAIQLVELPKASFLSLAIQPHDDAGEVDDWKALLEAQLQAAYTALTKGDTLLINDPSNSARHYTCLVSEVKPADAVLIVDTDVDLEIIPPLTAVSGRSAPQKNTSSEPLVFNLAKQPQHSITIPRLSPNSTTQAKFVLEAYDASLPFSISLSNLHDSPADPNLLNIFVSPSEYASSSTAFAWSTLLDTDQRQKSLIIAPGDPHVPAPDADTGVRTLYTTLSLPAGAAPDTEYTNVTVTFSNIDTIDEEEAPVGGDATRCTNCGQMVPARSQQLHLNFCLRRNIACPRGCGLVFSRPDGGVPAEHWHCELCPNHVYGNATASHEFHMLQVHTPVSHCDACGLSAAADTPFENLPAAALHRVTTCPAKLHVCRFCHLRLPQDAASAADTLAGLTGHEAFCGGRTADCAVCGRAVRLRDHATHAAVHDLQRRAGTPPRDLCTNVTCGRALSAAEVRANADPVARVPLGLCARCYGPLHSAAHDPTGARLRARVERRYVLQLTRGCGKPFCANHDACATAMMSDGGAAASRLPMPEVLARVKSLMEEDDGSSGPFGGPAFRLRRVEFCVDETTTKRRMFVELVSGVERAYGRGWAARAIEEARGSERDARQWLARHAVTLAEEAGEA